MDSGFKRVRTAAIAAGSAGAMLVGALADPAMAALVATPANVTTGGVKYLGFQNFTGHQTTIDAFGPTTEDLFGVSSATKAADSDAWDIAMALRVNGKNYLDPDNQVDVTTVGGVGTTVRTAGKVGGAAVNTKFFMFNGKSTIRALYTFKNPSSTKTRKLSILIGSNQGQDSGTLIADSTDGDTNLENVDSWIVVGDESDPVSTHAFGTKIGSIQASPDDGEEATVIQYNTRLKPGQTRRLLYFIHLTDTEAQGSTDGPEFDNGTSLNTAGLLAGLSAGERKSVFNWTLPTS